jgi:hypothetical protein
MAKTIILIHGRHFKPHHEELEAQWRDALSFGFQRDYPDRITDLQQTHVEFVYYGDISKAFLLSNGLEYDEAADIAERRQMLAQLKTYKKQAFYQKSVYNNLPGKTAAKEALADSLGGILSFFRVSEPIISQVAPDMREYWNEESEFGTLVRYPMSAPLRQAMDNRQPGSEILVVAHSLGTLISYDTFWKFCRIGEYMDYWSSQVSLWITLGSPLADETVKRKLKGASLEGDRRYPANINRWINIAAEDDYISHDSEVANDFKEMRKLKLIKSIEDRFIYNLAVRRNLTTGEEVSNPHNELGYLIHPETIKAIAQWL